MPDPQQVQCPFLQTVEDQIPRELLKEECPNSGKGKVVADAANLRKLGEHGNSLVQGFLPPPGNLFSPLGEEVVRAVGNIQEENGRLDAPQAPFAVFRSLALALPRAKAWSSSAGLSGVELPLLRAS